MAEEKIQEVEIKNEEAEKQGEAQESPQEDLNQKISELNDKYLRLYSEFENFRRLKQLFAQLPRRNNTCYAPYSHNHCED